MAMGALNLVLENLNQVRNELLFDDKERNQLDFVYEELAILISFIEDEHETGNNNLVSQIVEVAYDGENIVDSFVINKIRTKSDAVLNSSLNLGDIIAKMKSMNHKFHGIYNYKRNHVISRPNSSNLELKGDIIVGLEEKTYKIKARLGRGRQQLDVIPIVGMAGLGKTTLATRVYNDPFITYSFDIRMWITVSQSYKMRDLILGLLESASITVSHEMTDQKLCQELRKRLTQRRYLVVIDDIWDIEAWHYLKRCLPNDHNESRILLTSRCTDVVLQAKREGDPLPMEFLTQDQSWDLLQKKVFGNNSCPPNLIEIGKKIARKCEGLPLAVVVIAGILATTEMSLQRWEEVAQSLKSYMCTDQKQYMETLALSYNHLPGHLKLCFLSLGAFQEDAEIPVRKLMLLWMAERFIRPEGQKGLEELAEESLMDLIHRNLLIVVKKKYDGGIKTCRLHDLLRDLSLEKAKESRFIHNNYGSEQVSVSKYHRHVCMHSDVLHYVFSMPFVPHVRSFWCFTPKQFSLLQEKTSFIYEAFRHIRVLDLRSILITFIPSEIEQLTLLRYLALRANIGSLPPSITNLCNLETLIVEGRSKGINLPVDIGRMVKLRHLYVKGVKRDQRDLLKNTNLCCITSCIPAVREPTTAYPIVLDNLQTISTLGLDPLNEDFLLMIPNIRKLGCTFLNLTSESFLKLDCLTNLETLKVSYGGWPAKLSSTYEFPSNLKKLTLSGFRIPWTAMSTIGRLPNLKVLKLLDEAFMGPVWETSDGEFLKLEFLKLQDLYIKEWNACCSHFPSLRGLVLVRCEWLEEIPYGLGNISTLESIEVNYSRRSAMISARKIQKDQESNGNDGLKILIHPDPDEFSDSQIEEEFSYSKIVVENFKKPLNGKYSLLALESLPADRNSDSKEVAYDAENIVDSFVLNKNRSKSDVVLESSLNLGVIMAKIKSIKDKFHGIYNHKRNHERLLKVVLADRNSDSNGKYLRKAKEFYRRLKNLAEQERLIKEHLAEQERQFYADNILKSESKGKYFSLSSTEHQRIKMPKDIWKKQRKYLNNKQKNYGSQAWTYPIKQPNQRHW